MIDALPTRGEWAAMGGVFVVTLFWLLWCRSPERRTRRQTWLPLAVAAVTCVLWAFHARVDWDEIEHLHAAWELGRGETPFVDFWQHHSPLTWMLLSPLVTLFGDGVGLLPAARVVAVILAVVSLRLTWKLAVRIHDGALARSQLLVVLLAAAPLWQFARLRPDSFALPLLLAALLGSLDLREGRRWAALRTGVFLGLAFAFTPKQLPLVLVPLLAAPPGRRLRSAGELFLGGVLGALPLLGYLLSTGTLEAYVTEVGLANAGRVSTSFPLPLAWAGIGLLGVIAALRSDQPERRTLACTAILASIGAMTSVQHVALYHWALPLLLIGALFSGLRPDGAGVRRLPAMLGVAAVFAAAFGPVVRQVDQSLGRFGEDLDRRSALLELSATRPVLLTYDDHPITRPNATRLHSVWQLRFTKDVDDRGPMQPHVGERFLQAFDEARPALVAQEVDGVTLPVALIRTRVLDPLQALEFERRLIEGYGVQEIEGRAVLVRRDLARSDR